MPVTATAAATTDTFRQLLFDLRRTTAVHITRLLLAVDPTRLEPELAAWERAAAALGAAGGDAAIQLTRRWLAAYARTSGLPESPPDVDIEPVQPNWHVATAAVWWRLTAGDPRSRALRVAGAEATRLAADQVIDTANRATVATVSQDPRMTGYRRVSSSTTCGACLALHGQLVGSADPYDRHAHCRCTAEPVFADLPERHRRPTGQERYDRMTPTERAGLFAGRGGPRKAELVDQQGLHVLVDRPGNHQIRETPITHLETP